MSTNGDAKHYLAFWQLQKKLGGRGRTTIYRDVENGRLPKPTKIGSRLYWNEADVDAAIASLAG
jgi:prophage regulatory protein